MSITTHFEGTNRTRPLAAELLISGAACRNRNIKQALSNDSFRLNRSRLAAIRTLKSFFGWLKKADYITENPLLAVSILKPKTPESKEPTDLQAKHRCTTPIYWQSSVMDYGQKKPVLWMLGITMASAFTFGKQNTIQSAGFP